MGEVRLEALRKVHSGGLVALEGMDLVVADGERVVLVGPSGCGKTTVLRLVAGLDVPSAGRVRVDGRDVTDLSPRDRDVAMVFQSYALYPHMTVRDNLAFPLRMRKVSRADVSRRVHAVACTLELSALLDRRPGQLSGGQRQRVALGRAIVREPTVFLMDEPLSNLDAGLRASMRAEIARLHRRLGVTLLYVTHDQEEAMTLGDRIVVLREGRVQQVGDPLEVYRRPRNAFVAGFIGSPAMNLLPCWVEGGAVGARLRGAGFALPVPAARALGSQGTRYLLGIRPQDVEVEACEAAPVRARVEVVERLGSETLLHTDLVGGAGTTVRVVRAASFPVRVGEPVALRFPPERIHLFDAGSGQRLPLPPASPRR